MISKIWQPYHFHNFMWMLKNVGNNRVLDGKEIPLVIKFNPSHLQMKCVDMKSQNYIEFDLCPRHMFYLNYTYKMILI